MNSKKCKYLYLTIIILLYIATTTYIFYIGRFETIYGAGVLGVIVIQFFGLVVLVLSLFLSKFNFRLSFMVFALIVSSIQFVLILIHEIDAYKPTYVINIPPNFEGCIYLFVTDNDVSDVLIDEHGIGYVGNKGKAKWEIQKANRSITDAFATSQQNEIIIRDSSNTTMVAYYVSCLEINRTNFYPPRENDYEIKPCMDSIEFLDLVEQGVIDESVLRKRVWKGNGDESSWVLDLEESRL